MNKILEMLLEQAEKCFWDMDPLVFLQNPCCCAEPNYVSVHQTHSLSEVGIAARIAFAATSVCCEPNNLHQ